MSNSQFNVLLWILCVLCSKTVWAGGWRLALVRGETELVYQDEDHEGQALVTQHGRTVFATRAEDYALLELGRSRSTGELIGRAGSAGAVNWWPTAMVLSNDGTRLYVAGNWPSAVLIGFLEPLTKKMRRSRVLPRNREPDYPLWDVKGLRKPRGIAISPDDRHLYVTSIADDSLVVLSPEFWKISELPTSGLDADLNFVEAFQDDDVHDGTGNNEAISPEPIPGATRVDGLHTPRGVIVSRDGRFLYVAGSGEDAIAVFQRDGETGRLKFVTAVKEPPTSPGYGLDEPLHLALAPDDQYLYVACAGDTVMVFARNRENGRLKWVQTVRNGEDGIDGLEFPRQVAVSPRGNLVCVAASGRNPGQAALSTFVRDATTGKLTLSHRLKDQEHPECGLTGISSVCFSPDGRHVYTTSLKFSVAAFVVKPQ